MVAENFVKLHVKLPIFKLHSDPGKVNLQFKFYCNKEMLDETRSNNFVSIEIEEDEELIDVSEENQDKSFKLHCKMAVRIHFGNGKL